MPKNTLVGGYFEDFKGNLLANGYLILELSGDGQTGALVSQFLAQQTSLSDLFELETGDGVLELETSDGSQQIAQVVGGLPIRINLDMLGNIYGTVPSGIPGFGFGEGGFGFGGFGGGNPTTASSRNGPSVWPNDVLIPTNTVYFVMAFKYDGTKAWKTPQQWAILSIPSPFDVGTLGTYPQETPTPNIVDVLPALLGIIPTSRFIPGGNNPVLIQVNGVNAGSQIKLNMVAGTGMTIVDDGLGDITFAAATGSGNAPLVITTASANGTLAYGATPWVVELDTTGVSGITRTLPSASGNAGSVFVLKKTDSAAGIVTVSTTGGQTVDGQSSWLVTNQFQFLAVVSDGSNWQVFSAN